MGRKNPLMLPSYPSFCRCQHHAAWRAPYPFTPSRDQARSHRHAPTDHEHYRSGEHRRRFCSYPCAPQPARPTRRGRGGGDGGTSQKAFLFCGQWSNAAYQHRQRSRRSACRAWQGGPRDHSPPRGLRGEHGGWPYRVGTLTGIAFRPGNYALMEIRINAIT